MAVPGHFLILFFVAPVPPCVPLQYLRQNTNKSFFTLFLWPQISYVPLQYLRQYTTR